MYADSEMLSPMMDRQLFHLFSSSLMVIRCCYFSSSASFRTVQKRILSLVATYNKKLVCPDGLSNFVNANVVVFFCLCKREKCRVFFRYCNCLFFKFVLFVVLCGLNKSLLVCMCLCFSVFYFEKVRFCQLSGA